MKSRSALFFACALLAAAQAHAGLLVGAARVNLAPRPADYGGTWVTDADDCRGLDPVYFEQLFSERAPEKADHLAAAGSPWNENPDCLYMGGFGIGPMNPIVAFDPEYGLWARAVAISDGTPAGTVVLTVLDAEGYFWNYAQKCPDFTCGARDLAAEFGGQTGIPAGNFIISATHSHASPDLIGGWGFVPGWYMRQVSDAIREAVTGALTSLQPATLEIGEEIARAQNRERRDTYRSAEEQQLTWLRATATGNVSGTGDSFRTRMKDNGKEKDRGGKKKDPPPAPGQVIAVLGAYAAHPTTKGTNGGIAHADWPGLFVHRVEERFGGVGLLVMTGLGNMSAAGGVEMGTALADLVPDAGTATHRVADGARIRATQSVWNHPTTNVPLTALGLPGFFDREFNPAPAEVRTGKSPDTAPCLSGSPFSVEVAVKAIRIGSDLAITTGPGELFSNLTNTIKEQSGARVTMPLAQSNDALGYMPQDFEMNVAGQQGLGFGVSGALFVNYEDSYAIDHCFGDKALEESIRLLDELNTE